LSDKKCVFPWHERPQKKILISALCIYLGSIVLASFYQVGDVLVYKDHYTFTKEKWASADENERGRLIDSFRTIHDLKGENISVAEELLGAPDERNEASLVYYIGDYNKWMALDPYIYRITFDIDNIITADSIGQL